MKTTKAQTELLRRRRGSNRFTEPIYTHRLQHLKSIRVVVEDVSRYLRVALSCSPLTFKN